MSNLDKYTNVNIKEVLEETTHLEFVILSTEDRVELTKPQLIAILSSVSQGTPPDLAFRAEGLHQLFKQLCSFNRIFEADISMPECRIYNLVERVWFKSLSRVTNNIYRSAISEDSKVAISAAKLLLEYHEKMETKMHHYDAIRNLK